MRLDFLFPVLVLLLNAAVTNANTNADSWLGTEEVRGNDDLVGGNEATSSEEHETGPYELVCYEMPG